MIKASRIFALCRSQQKHCSLNAGRSKLAHFFSFSLSISLAPSHSHVVFLSNFLLLQLLLLTAVIMHSPHFPAFPPPQQRATTRKNGRACEWERNIFWRKREREVKAEYISFFLQVACALNSAIHVQKSPIVVAIHLPGMNRSINEILCACAIWIYV